MANIAKTYTLVNGQPADATQVNKNFDDIINGVGDVTTLHPTVASLGLDADIATLALPANTTISAAGAKLINDADAAAQITTLGAVATGDSRLSDARTPTAHTHVKANISDFPASMPASDVSAWAKAGTKPAYATSEITYISVKGQELINGANPTAMMATLGAVATGDSRLSNARPASDVSAWAKAASNVAVPGAFGCNGKTAQTATDGGPALPTVVLGTYGIDTAAHAAVLFTMIANIHDALVANGIMS